ncbi:hypothetical protein ABT121_43570 [Streptomyces sp. NPDC001928]|uniref:hypothetical protein n=1 Tax=Streptomyces sp. NPDC001928 TaxID=3154404 RepID=UPI00331E6DA1
MTEHAIPNSDHLALAVSLNFRCSDCNAGADLPERLDNGWVRVHVQHQDNCPSRSGLVDPVADLLRALDRAS